MHLIFYKKFDMKQSQAELFKHIWETRPHICSVCWKEITKPKTYCFAHYLPKWSHTKYKYRADNISLVCSMECHDKLDTLMQWKYHIFLHHFRKNDRLEQDNETVS